MWTLEQVKKECERLSSLKKDTFSVPVSLNGRFTRAMGRVGGRKTPDGVEVIKMEFCKKFIENGSDEDIKKVIAHEWAHYYLTKTTGQQHGHDAAFHALALEVGGEPTGVIEVDMPSETKEKYTLYCTKCGERLGGYNRAGKTIKEIGRFKSTCCEADIKVVQNY